MIIIYTLFILIIGISVIWIFQIRESIQLEKEYEQLRSNYKTALRNEKVKYLTDTTQSMLQHKKLAYLDLESMINDIEMLRNRYIELKPLEEAVRKRKVEMENYVSMGDGLY